MGRTAPIPGGNMIKYDVRCGGGHRFEAWFASSDAFDRQSAAGEVACPHCGGRDVVKVPMAPRIGKGSAADRAEAARQVVAKDVERRLGELRRHVEQNCDFVGDRFAEEARRIHYGERPQRDIYGDATEREAGELAEEGIRFARLPWPSRADS